LSAILSVPNLSEGRDFGTIEKLRLAASASGSRLLDFSSDIDHNRSVFTIGGDPAPVVDAVAGLARTALVEIDMSYWSGSHPAVGAIDVAPFVWTGEHARDECLEAAAEVAGTLADLGIPVFFYGEMATAPERRERSWFRRGGLDRLWQRMSSGDLVADLGPDLPHPTAGATLVTARPPLAAFNVEIEGGPEGIASTIAAEIRESGGGPSGLRAIGIDLSTGREQVSMNVEDPVSLPLAEVVELVSDLSEELGGRAVEAELIGLIPASAMVDYPAEVPIRGFDPDHHLIENRLTELE
jgi:glutamate formiminotransferase